MSNYPKYHILPLTTVPTTSLYYTLGNNMYLATGTSNAFSLPSAAGSIIGSVIQICGTGSGTWTLTQGSAGQIIYLGANGTSSSGGFISCTDKFDCATLICVGNYVWVVSGYTGTLTLH